MFSAISYLVRFKLPIKEAASRIAMLIYNTLLSNTSLLNFSTGQILCFLMIVFAIVTSIILYNMQKKKK
jgi:phosphatidylglycerol:prolipoprotein diacylglycerol transferase